MKALMTALLFGTVVALGACESEPNVTDRTPALQMKASHTKVLTGEIVTFTASSQNVVGRDADVEWKTSGGELRQDENNPRIARVTFDQPGTYIVTSQLMVDGQPIDSATETIQVRPLNR